MRALKNKVPKHCYKFRDGFRKPKGAPSAEEVGKHLDKLRATSNEELRPEAVVEEAKSPTSPLHAFFTWDDTAAAIQWRLQQARQLVRSIVYEVVADTPENAHLKEHPKPPILLVSAYHSVHAEGETETHYAHTDVVVKRPDYMASLLASALAELRVFRKKYANLKELATLFNVIDKLEDHP